MSRPFMTPIQWQTHLEILELFARSDMQNVIIDAHTLPFPDPPFRDGPGVRDLVTRVPLTVPDPSLESDGGDRN